MKLILFRKMLMRFRQTSFLQKALLLFLVLFFIVKVFPLIIPRIEIRLITTGYTISFSFGKNPAAKWERVGPGILRFSGDWKGDGSSIAQLQSLLNEPVDVVRVVNSGGGETNEAIANAELLLPFRPRIVVEEFCASSCANYLLPIAREINVRNGAVIAYHGTVCEVDTSSDSCSQEQVFWTKLPNGALVSKLPVGMRAINIPAKANGWMPTKNDFIKSGYPPIIFDWYPEQYTFTSYGVYIAPMSL